MKKQTNAFPQHQEKRRARHRPRRQAEKPAPTSVHNRGGVPVCELIETTKQADVRYTQRAARTFPCLKKSPGTHLETDQTAGCSLYTFSAVPTGLYQNRAVNPAMNRRAIGGRPYGTGMH